MQLVKYLASMSSNLKENEIKILKDKPIWPKENSSSQSNGNESREANPQRFIARYLHAPLALHREFGLPLLDWKGKWARNSHEGIII